MFWAHTKVFLAFLHVAIWLSILMFIFRRPVRFRKPCKATFRELHDVYISFYWLAFFLERVWEINDCHINFSGLQTSPQKVLTFPGCLHKVLYVTPRDASAAVHLGTYSERQFTHNPWNGFWWNSFYFSWFQLCIRHCTVTVS